MKKAINHWSFPSDWPLEKCLDIANEANFIGYELTMDTEEELNLERRQAEITRIGGMVKERGLEIAGLASALLWKYPITSPDEKMRRKAHNIVVKMIEIADVLGTDTILVIPGVVGSLETHKELVSYEYAYTQSLEAFKQLALVAEKHQVNIGLENVWNKFLLSPLEMRDFIDKIGSPFVGSYLDVGNVLLTGYPQDWIKILGSRIKRIHLKDFRIEIGNIHGFVDLLSGDVNWQAVMGALNSCRYNSYVTAEITVRNPLYTKQVIANTSANMDELLKEG